MRELGRMPVPQAGGQLFEVVLRTALGQLRSAIYGVGPETTAEMGNLAQQLHRRRTDGGVGQSFGPSILVRARYGRVPLVASVAYNSVDEREAALRRISKVGRTDFLGTTLQIDDALPHPSTPVPSLRFVNALSRLTGRPIEPQLPEGLLGAPGQLLDLETEVARRIEVVHAVRALCSKRELQAYDLEQPQGIVYAGTDGTNIQVELAGSRRTIRLADLPPSGDPLLRARLADQLSLGPGEYLRRIRSRTNKHVSSPEREEIIGLFERARAFNKTQMDDTISFELADLTRRLSESLNRELDDATALWTKLPHLHPDAPPSAADHYLLLAMDTPTDHLVSGAHAILFSASVPNGSQNDTVTIRVVTEAPTMLHSVSEVSHILHRHFDVTITPEQLGGWSGGVARSTIARLLGYIDEVSFAYTEEGPFM